MPFRSPARQNSVGGPKPVPPRQQQLTTSKSGRNSRPRKWKGSCVEMQSGCGGRPRRRDRRARLRAGAAVAWPHNTGLPSKVTQNFDERAGGRMDGAAAFAQRSAGRVHAAPPTLSTPAKRQVCPRRRCSPVRPGRQPRRSRSAHNAAPTIPASFRNSAGTILARGFTYLKNLACFALTPPPMMISSGQSSRSRMAM